MPKVCLVLVLGIFGPSSQWTVKSYPTLDENCGIQKPTLICDPDNVLAIQDRQYANFMLHQINQVTECDCFNKKLCTNDTGGYTVGVAVIKSMEAFGPRMPGDPELIETFAQTTRHRWNLGHCGDDALVVICTDCERAFTNYTLVMDFLLTNYLTYLNNRNQTPSLAMMKFPFEDLSTGVITVMILTSLLSVVWVVCVTYLVVQIVVRRRGQKVAAGKVPSTTVLSRQKSSLDLDGSLTSAERLALRSPPTITSTSNGLLSGPQLTRFELQRSPCWDRPIKWRWSAPRSSTSPAISGNGTDPFGRRFSSERRVCLAGRQKLDVLGLFEGRNKKKSSKNKNKRSLRVKSFTASSSTPSTSLGTDDTLLRNESLPNFPEYPD